jgi:hypothetical protein
MNIKLTVSLVVAIAVGSIAGCAWNGHSGSGLYLPRGNAEQGRQAFIDLECHHCHTITGVSLPAILNETPMVTFNIGGVGSRVNTYSDLVTAIINPTHITSPEYVENMGKLAADAGTLESPMPVINDRMTVTQLVDIVMLLNARYEDLFLEYTVDAYVAE